MTDQVPDTVDLESKTFLTWSSPLDGYFIERGMDTVILDTGCHCTACHRGYVAGWSIDDGLLRLKSLTSFGGEVDLLRRVFGGWRRKPIFAVWFTGDLYLYAEENLEVCIHVQVVAGRVTAQAFVQPRLQDDVWGNH